MFTDKTIIDDKAGNKFMSEAGWQLPGDLPHSFPLVLNFFHKCF